MSIKHISIILMLLLVFIGGVHASEVNHTSDILNDGESDEIVDLQNQDLLSGDNSFSDLQNEIDSSDNVSLQIDYTFSETNDKSIIINKNMTIDGNGHVIDANGKSNIFIVNSERIILKNLVFKNSNSTNGSAIYFNNTQNAILENCKFINSVSEKGAIYFTGGDLKVDNCEFINCSSKLYQFIYDGYEAFYRVTKYLGVSMLYVNSSAQITVSRSNFSNSKFSDYGIKIDNASSIIFHEDSFEDNVVLYDEELYNSTTSQYYPPNHYKAGAYDQYCDSTLFSLNAENIEISNSKFLKNMALMFMTFESNQFTFESSNISDSTFISLLMGHVNSTFDFENMKMSNINGTLEWEEWIPEIQKYFHSISSYGDTFIMIESDGELNSTIKDVWMNNISSFRYLIEIVSKNFEMDNVNLNGLFSYSEEVWWSTRHNRSISTLELSMKDVFSIESTNSTVVRNVNVNNAILDDGSLFNIVGGDITLSDSNFSNITEFEGLVKLVGKNIVIDNILIKDKSVGFNETSYDESLIIEWSYYCDTYAAAFDVEGNNVTFSNVLIVNATVGGNMGVFTFNCDNLNITNVSLVNSTIVAGEEVTTFEIGGRDVILKDILIENVKIGPALDMDYDYSYKSYVSDAELEYTGPGIYLYSQNAYLDNITIINSETTHESSLLDLYSEENMTVKNILIKNITERAPEEWLILLPSELISYEWRSGEVSNQIRLESDNSISLINLTVENVESPLEDFLSLRSPNIDVCNISITNSSIGGGEDDVNIVDIYADNLTFDSVIIKNITPNDVNVTKLFIRNYNYYSNYYASGYIVGVGVNIETKFNATVSNVYISNVCGGYEGILNIDAGNATVYNVTIVDTYFTNFTSFKNSSEDGITTLFRISKSNPGIIVDATDFAVVRDVLLSNGSINSGNLIYISGYDVFVGNLTVTDIKSQMASYDVDQLESGQYISKNLMTNLEEIYVFEAKNQLDLVNLSFDSVPGCYDTSFLFGAKNISLSNSTFKNVYCEYMYKVYNKTSKGYDTVEYNNIASLFGFVGNLANITNVSFESITFGGKEGGVLIMKVSDLILDNCTFRDINSSYICWEMIGGKNVTTEYDTKGSVMSFKTLPNSANIVDTKFINCSADYGGALYVTCPINITRSSFINCSSIDGGAIYFTNTSSNSSIVGTNFTENTAKRNGGAIYIYENEKGVNLIENSIFLGNHADYNGGAFFYNNTIEKRMFEDYRWYNRTILFADDLRELNEKNTKILNSKFENNTDYSLKLNAKDDDMVDITLPKDAKGSVYVTLTDENGKVVNDADGKPINGSYTLVDGSVSFKLNKLAPGKYNLSAHYSNYDYETSPYYYHINSTLFKIKNALNANVTAENVTEDENVTFTIEVPNNFTGNVSIVVDGKEIYNGTVNSTIVGDKLTPGDKTANVTFYGDDEYEAESVTVKFTVEKAKPTIDAVDMTRGWNSPFDYQAKFLDKMQNPLANADVTFMVNGKQYAVKTDSNGIAKLTDSKLAIGEYDITSINNVTGENVTSKLFIVKRIVENKDLTMDYKDHSKFTVRAIGDDGKPVGSGEIVLITTNGVKYKCVSDKNGYARLPIELLPRTYAITAEYKNYKVTNKLIVKQTLKAVKKTVTVKKSAKSFKIKASLKFSNGKAISGKKIVFKLNGKKYSAKTNKKGIATVTIKKLAIKKLKKGKTYTVRIVYSAKVNNYSNKIAHDIVKCYVKVK